MSVVLISPQQSNNAISWDRTSVIFRVGVSYLMEDSCHMSDPALRIASLPTAYSCTFEDSLVKSLGMVPLFAHTLVGLSFSMRSPSGKILLTRLTRAVKVWSEVRSFTSRLTEIMTNRIGWCV